ncbi:MAG: YggS family pyridoxal phosphate-dependent enzyme [Lachnospiraceae bacterium]|nr:YggS family pyridoxal phosphate-dependent enzyme [Lachnospiraceae bacterium]
MNSDLAYMKQNIEEIREKMAHAAQAAGRRPEDVLLLAACKTRTIEEVKESARLPIDLFGENHVQELIEKKDADAYLGKSAHLIGHLQTNKIKYVLGRAELIQSMDSEHLLTALEKAAAKRDMVQDVLIEVNIGAEESKTGLAADNLWRMLELSAAQPHIRVKGLMTIPPANTTDLENRKYFEKTRMMFEKAKDLKYDHVSMEILSMGMSQDYENAILEGSTMIRVGSLIYGPRG